MFCFPIIVFTKMEAYKQSHIDTENNVSFLIKALNSYSLFQKIGVIAWQCAAKEQNFINKNKNSTRLV